MQLTIPLRASKEDLWEAWIRPSLVKRWFGSDPAGRVLSADLDVRQGGKFAISFRDSDGTEHTCAGTYSKVIKPDALSFTWEWKSEPGHVSRINIQFLSAKATGTSMEFEHKDLNPNSLHGYEKGWTSTFQKLNRLLLKQSG